MPETTVEYKVCSEYLRGAAWMRNVHTFTARPAAEQYYDDIVRLEKAYGTPRNPRMLKRTMTLSDWDQVDRHA